MFLFRLVSILCLGISLTVGFPPRSSNSAKNETGNLYYEGDIIRGPGWNRTGRTSMTSRSTYWPGGVVPFIYGEDFDESDVDAVIKAMERIEEESCIEFRWAFESDSSWVAIVKVSGGCASSIGRIGGEQELKLGSGCFSQRTIMHELMHALGFEHEQSRHDRDKYVKVHYENIEKVHHTNFEVLEEDDATTYGLPYDYASIMHYGEYDFASEEGLITIEPVRQTDVVLGTQQDLSKLDIKRLNKRYPCKVKLAENSKNNPRAKVPGSGKLKQPYNILKNTAH